VARRGKFGRLPRTAPDLTGAVVALIREAAAQHERNVIDAWKEGGKVDGKKVTDEALLAHFDEKLEGLSPHDPTYVEAKNTRDQYAFAVRNSKMELGYAQHKQSDGAMARFYKNEASKHPKNSEAWRELMKASAGYQDRVNQGSGGGGGGGGGGRRGRGGMSIEERNWRITTPRREELAWTTYEGVLLELARDRGILLKAKNPDAASATTGPEGFADMQAWGGDFTAIQQLINEFATSPDFADDRAALTKYIQTYGQADFNGDFSMAGSTQMRTDFISGVNRRIDTHAKLGGTATQLKDLRKLSSDATVAGGTLGVIDPMQRYEEGRKRFNAILESDSATPLEIAQAVEDWKKELVGVYNDLEAQAIAFRDPSLPSGSRDDGWTSVKVGKVRGELDGLMGNTSLKRDTLFEESSGHATDLTSGESAAKGDQQFLADIVNINNGFMEMLADPIANAVIAKVDDNGEPSNDPDAEWGAVNAAKLAASGNPVAYSMVSREKGGLLPGMPVMQATYGQPITVTQAGTLDRMGQPTELLEPAPGTGNGIIGAVFTRPDGSQFYGLNTAGGMRYTNTAPWADGATATTNTDGSVTVALPPTQIAGKTTYDPLDAVDDRYIDPTLFTAMPNTMLSSTVEADMQYRRSSRDRDEVGPWANVTPTEMERMIAAESGGDALKSEQLRQQYLQNIASDKAKSYGARTEYRTNQYRRPGEEGDRPLGGVTYVSDAEMRRRALEFINRPGMRVQVGGELPFDLSQTRLTEMQGPGGGTYHGIDIQSDRELAEEAIRTAPANQLASLVKEWTGQWMQSASGSLAKGQGPTPAMPAISPIATAATYGITPKPARNRAGEDAAEAAFYRGSGKTPPSGPQVNAYTGFTTTAPVSTPTINASTGFSITPPPPPSLTKPSDRTKDDEYVPPPKYYTPPPPPDLPGIIKGSQPQVRL
jgi:hypothetical protein